MGFVRNAATLGCCLFVVMVLVASYGISAARSRRRKS
jgi:hypothetical protein